MLGRASSFGFQEKSKKWRVYLRRCGLERRDVISDHALRGSASEAHVAPGAPAAWWQRLARCTIASFSFFVFLPSRRHHTLSSAASERAAGGGAAAAAGGAPAASQAAAHRPLCRRRQVHRHRRAARLLPRAAGATAAKAQSAAAAPSAAATPSAALASAHPGRRSCVFNTPGLRPWLLLQLSLVRVDQDGTGASGRRGHR